MADAIVMYGLKNCDTCRKARKWLAAEGLDHRFVDVRADGITVGDIARWQNGTDTPWLNRRGTTWRGLSDADKARADNDADVLALGAEYPALIKRPVFEVGTQVMIGFDDRVRATLKAG